MIRRPVSRTRPRPSAAALFIRFLTFPRFLQCAWNRRFIAEEMEPEASKSKRNSIYTYLPRKNRKSIIEFTLSRPRRPSKVLRLRKKPKRKEKERRINISYVLSARCSYNISLWLCHVGATFLSLENSIVSHFVVISAAALGAWVFLHVIANIIAGDRFAGEEVKTRYRIPFPFYSDSAAL